MILILCLLCTLHPSAYAVEHNSALSIEEFEVLKIVNQERAKEGTHPLTSIPELQRATDIRAAELVEVTDHVRPDGSDWVTVLEGLQIPRFMWAGENVAAGQLGPVSVISAWMNSPGHRSNILDSNYTHMGVGYHYDEDSYYGTHWVQLFYSNYYCNYTSMTLGFYGKEFFEVGTAVDDLSLVACLQCESCGNSYLPVLAEYCSGYDPNVTESQEITVSVLGQTAKIDVTLGSESQETEPSQPPAEPGQFYDLTKGSWYEDSVKFMVEQGLMNGVGNGRFHPEGFVTRAMLVTILYRLEGEPSVEGLPNPFRDVPRAWYTDAVIWAVNHGIVTGVTYDRFNPDGNITREQIATILYRYEGSPEAPDTLPPFADNRQISQYALRPMNWAITEGLINGIGGGFLAPANTATRAQIATILARYIQKQ